VTARAAMSATSTTAELYGGGWRADWLLSELALFVVILLLRATTEPASELDSSAPSPAQSRRVDHHARGGSRVPCGWRFAGSASAISFSCTPELTHAQLTLLHTLHYPGTGRRNWS
jgi:hypothetical protein